MHNAFNKVEKKDKKQIVLWVIVLVYLNVRGYAKFL